jgi:adenosylhomocysteine nucleosidase
MATELTPAAPAITVPCIVFTLRRESMYFRRAYRLQQRFCDAPCCAQFRGERRKRGPDASLGKTRPDPFCSVMLETGIGAAAMETALRWCLSGPRFGGIPYRPRLLVSAGFSGALQAEQRVGDLVLATEVIDAQGQRWPAFQPPAWTDRAIAAGRLLTMPKLVSDPQEKRRLGRQYEALAVDMESAVVARLCHHHNVPFACLRVISDDGQTALSPHLVGLLRQQRVSLPRLAAQLLRHPQLIGELVRLAGQTRHAAQQLLAPLAAVILGG